MRQTWRSCTLVTPGTATIASATASASISDGVASMRIDVESRSTPHALATISRAIPIETMRVDERPAGGDDHERRDEDGARAEQIGHDVAKGGFDVQALPARPDQDPGRRCVHEQSQERDDEHPAAEDLGRVAEPLDRLPDDPAADQHECQPVDECRQDLRPLEAEAAHRRGRSAGQRHGHEGQCDRDVVGQHVTRVREEGEAVRPDSPGDLDHRERQGEQEHPEERAA